MAASTRRSWRRRLIHLDSDTGAIPRRVAALLVFVDMRSATIRSVAFWISDSDVAACSSTHARSRSMKHRSRAPMLAIASHAYSSTIRGSSLARPDSDGSRMAAGTTSRGSRSSPSFAQTMYWTFRDADLRRDGREVVR